MPGYAAFLRGVSPMNAKMPQLKAAFERIEGQDVFGAYVQNPKGPVFMTLIEKTLGNDLTTRTWDTAAKVAR